MITSYDIGNQTNDTIQNLAEEQTYYFTVTEYDTYNDEVIVLQRCLTLLQKIC